MSAFGNISRMKLFALVLTGILLVMALWLNDAMKYETDVNEEVGLVTTQTN